LKGTSALRKRRKGAMDGTVSEYPGLEARIRMVSAGSQFPSPPFSKQKGRLVWTVFLFVKPEEARGIERFAPLNLGWCVKYPSAFVHDDLRKAFQQP
jgi:hypothetical protein